MEPRDDEQQMAHHGTTEKKEERPHQRTRLGLERLEERVAPSHFQGLDWYFEHNVTPPHFYW
jgi:hypothetical protein